MIYSILVIVVHCVQSINDQKVPHTLARDVHISVILEVSPDFIDSALAGDDPSIVRL